MKTAINSLKERIAGYFSGLSAVLSTLGSSFNICHSLCMGLLAFLAGLGIIINGFPLFFLFQYNIQLWGIALLLLMISLILYYKKPKCTPKNLLIFNAGAIIAGIPANLIDLQPFSLIIGGIIAASAIAVFLLSKIQKKEVP